MSSSSAHVNHAANWNIQIIFFRIPSILISAHFLIEFCFFFLVQKYWSNQNLLKSRSFFKFGGNLKDLCLENFNSEQIINSSSGAINLNKFIKKIYNSSVTREKKKCRPVTSNSLHFFLVCDFSIVQTWLYENLVPVYLYTCLRIMCVLVSQSNIDTGRER